MSKTDTRCQSDDICHALRACTNIHRKILRISVTHGQIPYFKFKFQVSNRGPWTVNGSLNPTSDIPVVVVVTSHPDRTISTLAVFPSSSLNKMYRETRCVCDDDGQEGDGGGDHAESRPRNVPRSNPYPLDRSQSDVTTAGMANGGSSGSANGHFPNCLQRRRYETYMSIRRFGLRDLTNFTIMFLHSHATEGTS